MNLLKLTLFQEVSIEKNIFLLIVIIVLASCQKDKKVTYYSNGEIHKEYEIKDGVPNGIYKIYYPNGNLQSHSILENNILNGESIYYYENGNIKLKGDYKNGLKIGKHYEFNENKDNLTEFIGDYLIVQGEEYLISKIFYDYLGNVNEKTSLYQINVSQDTVDRGELIKIEIISNNRKFDKSRLLIGEYDENFYPSENILYDTIIGNNFKYSFSRKGEKLGNNFIRGIIENYQITFNPDSTRTELLVADYFEIKFYVK